MVFTLDARYGRRRTYPVHVLRCGGLAIRLGEGRPSRQRDEGQAVEGSICSVRLFRLVSLRA